MERVWECHKCNWFIYPSALKWQEKLGIQTQPWTCPECKGLLVEKEASND